MTRYLIIIEETATGYSAYSPDLPGCVATGSTHEEIEREMHDAIEFHIEGFAWRGEQIPETSFAGHLLRGRCLISPFPG